MAAISMSTMRALACDPSVRIGICHDIQERDFTPACCSAIAKRPIVTCSPVATTTSYSRASCKGAISLTHFTS